MHNINMSDLILPGSLVSIRAGNELTWHVNIVYRCGNDYIDIPLTDELLRSLIFVDAAMTIKYKNEKFEYVINGVISKIDLCRLPFIRIKYADISESLNNRMFPRYDVYLPANLSVNGNNIFFCKILSISLGGFSFMINKELSLDNECEANIYLNEKTSIFGIGTIIRCLPQGFFNEFSMQFTYMDEDNSNILSSCLHSIDRSFDNLRDKYLSAV